MPRRDPPKTEEGLYVSHLMLRLRSEAPDKSLDELTELATGKIEFFQETARHEKFDLIRLVSSKADFMTILFAETIEQLEEFQRSLLQSEFGQYLERIYTFLSVTELSMYEPLDERVENSLKKEGLSPDDDNYDDKRTQRRKRLKKYQEMRLDPDIPDMDYATFYPMTKRRKPNQNWYQLPKEERSELMSSHGKIGRQYAGKVQQIITSCVGLDDWEWGVTLYSDNLKQFKRLIYEMRFDEVSASYSDFGPFYTGQSIEPEELTDFIGA